MNRTRAILSIFVSLTLISACNLFLDQENHSGFATLAIRAEYEGQALGSAKTIIPAVPVPAAYVLLGYRDPDTVFADLATFSDLAGAEISIQTGTWYFRLEAKDAEGHVMLEAERPAAISGTPGVISFILMPVASGAGTIKFDISWPASLPAPVASAEAAIYGPKPSNTATIIDPAPSIIGNSLSFERGGVEAGEYVLVFKLRDAAGKLLSVVSELVRVAPYLISTGTRTLVAAELNSPPPAPINLTGEYAALAVTLTWTDVSSIETGFVVERSSDGWTNIDTLADLTSGAESYIDSALVRGAAYAYRVVAVNDFGRSAASAEFDVTVPCLISFDSQGGSAVADLEAATGGVTLPVVALSRLGYAFVAWNTEVAGTGTPYAAGASFPMPLTNVTLYAQWTANSYNLIYAGNGYDGGTIPSATAYGYNASATVSENGTMVRAGYSFAGWNTAADGSGTPYAANAVFAMPANDLTLYAQWSINSYTVSYDGNGADGGVAPSPTAHAYNSAVTAAPASTFTRAGHILSGWNTAANGSGGGYATDAQFPMPAAAIVLYAQWMANANTVNFNANGGSGTMANQTIATGSSSALNANIFTRAGYAFAGWNTLPGGSGTVYADGADLTMGASSIILYAQWTAIGYSVAFAANDGIGAMADQTIPYGATAALTANAFTRIGYSFASWNTQAAGGGTSYVNSANYTMLSTSTVTLYAQWTANNYAVAFAANGGTGSMANQSIAYDTTAVLTANAFTRTGYNFTGWNTIAGGGGTAYADGANYIMLSTSTVTLYAQWTANDYAVAFAANGGSGTMPNQTIAYGTTVALTANAFTQTGYSFAGWNSLAGGGGTAYANGANYTMLSTSTVTLYAQWTANDYAVAFAANGGSGSMPNQTIAYDTTAALTVNAFTRTGYSFTGWNTIAGGGGAAYANSANYTMLSTSTVTLYAQWTANSYTVAFDINGGSGSMLNQTIVYGTTAALTANAFTRTGYLFAGWNTLAGGGGTACADGANYTMLSTSNVTLYAQWTANNYAVAFAANGGSGSMANQNIAYDTIAALTANAFTRIGYSFTGWNTIAGGGGTAYTNGANYTMLSTATVILYAQWMAASNAVNFNANGGTGTMGDQMIATNATEALAANAYIRTGYSFTGWNTLANGAGTQYANGADYTMGSTSIILYAQWTADNYAVTFAANGGSGSMANQSIAYDATAALTANAFTRIGYNFTGWNTIAGGGGASFANGANYTMLSTSTVTLYAQWTSISTINITISIGTGDLITITGPTTVAQGAMLNVTVTEAFTAYDWYMDGESVGLFGKNAAISTGGLKFGIHTLMVVTTNGAGEQSSASYRFTVTN